MLLATMFEAMRHGYNDTERFSTLAAALVRRHVGDGSVGWLIEAFEARVCHSRAAQRSLFDVALRLLGPS